MQTVLRKPSWLKKKIDFKKSYEVACLLKGLKLNTVCQESLCPNISECFSRKTATFLILGSVCTRTCRFCNVKKGRPQGLNLNESGRIVEAVRKLSLSHVVITSVTRDDLADGGADVFERVILDIRRNFSKVAIEVLIPDFKGNREAIKKVIGAGPDIIGHNLETIPGFYEILRDADYGASLGVLRFVKEYAPHIFTKSGLMLGLGETEGELFDVFRDLGRVNCDFLSIGQYLAPSSGHCPVKEYITPEKFAHYKEKALSFGLRYVLSGPYVRSSYHAEEYLTYTDEHR
ncbi:MAG: lipoyl synthase [Candidatus Omnitrophota bacterium]|nr:lipoyl synthase [Candidatus Omnitrophota bacterium]